LRLPVMIDADDTTYDGNTSTVMFSGFRLSQGNINIQADNARASRIDFDDSMWRFTGNVIFDVEEGHVSADTADVEFSDFTLLKATITGSPATYRFRRDGSDNDTYAEAGRLFYDLKAGTIEFSGGATIIEGGNQISSETLVYNIRERRINAQASGDGSDRVKVIYTPQDPPRNVLPDADEELTDGPENRPVEIPAELPEDGSGEPPGDDAS
ncbi:MAG: LptA/OstA family protein, partial [Woeseiaceae bacterium]|nr:LptA/OstA family protein [Woeseiaceae bacterium]